MFSPPEGSPLISKSTDKLFCLSQSARVKPLHPLFWDIFVNFTIFALLALSCSSFSNKNQFINQSETSTTSFVEQKKGKD